MRGVTALNTGLYLPAIVFVLLALLLASTIFVLWIIWRRHEARRTHTRYVFDGIIGMAEQPPPKPHELCLGWLCFLPEHAPCLRSSKRANDGPSRRKKD